MIAAVATVKNEQDIIELTVRHLVAEGVDLILIADASTDGTRDLLDQLPVTWFDDRQPYHYQPEWINTLATIAHREGADWIIPFDADEFWYATQRPTIAEALNELPNDVRALHVQAWQHRDWYHREVVYRSHGKVAYRWEAGADIHPGNHNVNLPSRPSMYAGVLALREWQFRSLEHMTHKSRERTAGIDPNLPYTSGLHQRLIAAMTPDELAAEWERRQNVPVVYDPIPTKVTV